ncbi:MAG: ABC transporter ATP-binding protein [Afipia felis]|nr:ABC transporter ATP-binding protein [Afipia felis]
MLATQSVVEKEPPGFGEAPLLELNGVTKRYPLTVANDGINLKLKKGEIHAVLGENGAGKSTLMKLIFGVVTPDEGAIRWNGEEVLITSPAQARALGISMVFQHFTLFETITVAENISLTVPGSIQEISNRVRKISKEFGLPIEPNAMVHTLSIGERQRVEIVRCLLQDPSLLILDEPTSVLPPPSVEQLFVTLRGLSERGIAILYISHKLEEIRALCHSATILRQGRVTGTVIPAAKTAGELARLMIGKDLPTTKHAPARDTNVVGLEVNKLSTFKADPFAVNLDNISFEVRAGEILGIAGVSGNGQTLLTRLLSGEEPMTAAESGAIKMMGQPIADLNAAQRRNRKLAFVPEERLGRGAAATMSLSDNALLTAHRYGMVDRGLVRFTRRNKFTEETILDLDVRCSGRGALAASLSGGNLQKFIVGREMSHEPQVLVVAQPTWGIDVNAATMVRQKLVDLRDSGVAVLVVSEELEELFEISDRIAVMFKGRLSNAMPTRDADVETVGRMMMGMFDPTHPTDVVIGAGTAAIPPSVTVGVGGQA